MGPAIIALQLTLTPAFTHGAGEFLEVVDLAEAGSVYIGPSGSIPRYVTSHGPSLTFYEERLAQGQLTGLIRKAPNLVGALPAPGAPLTLSFFAADGQTPFFDSSLQHPRLVDTPSGLGMYVNSTLPTGPIYFFLAMDSAGLTWRFMGSIPVQLFAGGSGFLGVLRIPNASHAEGTELRIYNQDGGGRVTVLRSFSAALGTDKYIMLNPTSVLPLTIGGDEFSPTGEAFLLPGGGVGIFFVPQDDSYVGLAESPDGFNAWTITRDAANPILSSAANAVAPDPSRPNIADITLIATPTGFQGYFTGTAPGVGPASTAMGSLRVDFMAEFQRGDCNMDGSLDVADILCQLGFLFMGTVLPCVDAADSNDDGSLELGDVSVLIQFAYLGGAAPPAPFPACGTDPTLDNLACSAPPTSCP